MEIVVITQRSASTNLVESNLPPNPVSIIALSILFSLNANIETKNVTSKKVGLQMGGIKLASLISFRNLSKSSDLIGEPLILILSSIVMR